VTAVATANPPAPSPEPAKKPGFFGRLFGEPNAIWMREMRQAARVGRTPWVIFGLTLAISLLMCSIGGIAASENTSPATLGGGMFQAFFSIAYYVVIIVGPAVAANSIASEREGQTWEAVQLTGLHPKDIARGKFFAAYTTVALYIVALAPVGALPFLFGGVTPVEVIAAFAFLFLVAGLAVAFGLALSSLMASSRGAIVVTLILAIVIGPALYMLFGFSTSFAIHKAWSEVPEAFPIWLPLAYSRVPFGLEYAAVLIATPLLLVLVPAWFLYEVTVANLTNETDDRSSGLRRWFFFCAPMLAVAFALPSTFSATDSDHVSWAIVGLSAYGTFVGFCSLLFAFEPTGPSRRVRVTWARAHAGILRRVFGPGLMKASMMTFVMGVGGMVAITAIDMAVLVYHPPAGMVAAKHEAALSQIFVYGAYGALFFTFALGLTSWLRARGSTPWVARLVSSSILFLVTAGPWVVAAIAGAVSGSHDEEWMLVAAPSPCFTFYMLSHLDKVASGYGSTTVPVVQAGLACAAVWGVVGLGLLALASRRTLRANREQDAQFAQADAALRAEDDAIAAAAQQPASSRVQPNPTEPAAG
jgi:ABC-type transport system involved in multi-copper enzyme maturation permease subunit